MKNAENSKWYSDNYKTEYEKARKEGLCIYKDCVNETYIIGHIEYHFDLFTEEYYMVFEVR